MTTTGGDLLAATLAEFGVDTAFGVHGGHLDAFLVACRRLGIRLVDTRHEAVAVDAADGYARSSGRLGVAFATASSGYSNALAGLTTAFADRVPILVVTSSPPLRDAETNPLQGGIDPVTLASPVAKWAGKVTVAEELPRLVSLAIRKAVAGAPGPSVVDVPIDVMFGAVDEAAVSWGGGSRLAAPPAPDPTSVQRCVELLTQAERPAIIVGGGARGEHAAAVVLEFAERSGIPVFHHLPTFGAMPADHALNGWAASNLAVETAAGHGPDVVMLLGARTGMFLGGRSGSVIPSGTKLIQVDTDSSEIGRLLPFEVGLTADVAQTMTAILAASPKTWPAWSGWAGQVVAHQRAAKPWQHEPPLVGGRLHPFHAVREVMRSLEPGTRLIVDGGETAGWVAASVHEAHPREVLGFGGYLGFLGVTFGLAIGVQVVHPDDRVVLVIGDGAFGFHPQELDTMVRHRLPIVVVVVNNACWGMSIHGQREVFGAEGEIITTLTDTDYHAVGAGFGAYGERVGKLEDIGPALGRALSSGLPSVVNLEVSAEVVHPSTPAMVGVTDDPGVTVVPYYDNIVRRA
jgi:acetolactate synthase-1/2/3 large subunit